MSANIIAGLQRDMAVIKANFYRLVGSKPSDSPIIVVNGSEISEDIVSNGTSTLTLTQKYISGTVKLYHGTRLRKDIDYTETTPASNTIQLTFTPEENTVFTVDYRADI